MFSRKKVVIKLSDGSKWNYFIKNVKSFTHDNDFYKPLPKKPEKNSQNLVFTRLIMVNDSAEIYKYDDLVTSDFGPVYDWKYYLYIHNAYQSEINRKNYRLILKKYFNNCPLINSILSEDKNHFRDDRFSDLANEYMSTCQ